MAALLDYNETSDDYDPYHQMSNDSGYMIHEELLQHLKEFAAIDRDRKMFNVFYQVFAACIVILNVILVCSILVSRKQRRHFRNWLILHMTFIHILFGGISCPFLGQNLVKASAGLDTVICKLLYFFTDTLEYTANVSIAILGIYQCATMMSPRMLKGVSHALLASIMIVIPWLVCVMLTTVLRLTMTEETQGQCYIIEDETAHTLWIILAHGLPLLITFFCFIAMIAIALSPFITHIDSSPPGRQNMTFFIGLCLGTCLFMRTPFYFFFSKPIGGHCMEEYGALVCMRLTHSLDLIRLTSMVIIPLAYLIPAEVRKCFRRLMSKNICKNVTCTTTSKKQRMEMVPMSPNERTTI